MADLTNLSHEELADHIGAGLREAERRVPLSAYSDEDKQEVGELLSSAHTLLRAAEEIILGNGGVSARSGGDKT